MSGALAARPPRPLPALLPFLRIGLRSIWYFSSADADPPSPPASTTVSGSGPCSRQRLSSVIHTVNDRKLPSELRGRPNAIRSETDIVNVVEQRIWHSMEEGHFDNLPGKGKPLDLSTNPHADPAEDTLYRILSRNGCAPEWIELNKEIRYEIAEWRITLKKAWANRLNHKGSKWLEDSELLKAQIRNINSKVLRYNLMVPFGRQMFGLKWEKEIDKLNNLV